MNPKFIQILFPNCVASEMLEFIIKFTEYYLIDHENLQAERTIQLSQN